MSEWQLGNLEVPREWYAKAIDWMKQHPQIVGGELHRFRVEAEELLGISEPASTEADTTTEKNLNEESLVNPFSERNCNRIRQAR